MDSAGAKRRRDNVDGWPSSRKTLHNFRPRRMKFKALKAWYLTPGIQGDLRNKENGAVQMVLEVLERRLRRLKRP
jgi:hypothetical protein